MNTLWSAVELAARPLQSETREAVLGDLLESGASACRGLVEVLGLVAREQLLALKSWRPWLAVFGIAVPGSLVLMGFSVSVSASIEQLSRGNFFQMLRLGLVLNGCAWACGFALFRIALRMLWVSVVACCVPCALCLMEFRQTSLSPLCLFLFVLPAIWGVRQALRSPQIKPAYALLVAISILAMTVPFTNSLWIPNLVLVWPACYIAAISVRHYRKTLSPS